MSHQPPSIYPEFLKMGLDKLEAGGVISHDLLTLFSALENYQSELKTQERQEDILGTTHRYVRNLELFETLGFFLVNPEDFDFKLVWCQPDTESSFMENLIREQIHQRRFSHAIKQSGPVFFETQVNGSSRRGVLHALGVANLVMGMFCGVFRSDRVQGLEISLSLLSVLLGACSQALFTARNTADLKQRILAANRDLRRTLEDNEVLARIPAESPSPVIRVGRHGQIIYSNAAGLPLLEKMGCRIGDILTGDWQSKINDVFDTQQKVEFEASFGSIYYSFLLVAITDAGYANFYGTDITARKKAEADRERLITELQEALFNVKTLSGLLPICAWCKKVRDDGGYWKQIEQYIETHSAAVFSHSVCPDCYKKLSDTIG